MKPSLISIIIPVFNRAGLLPETLDSVLRQTYSEWECILVDDGSNDNTIEVIEQYVKKDNRFKLYIRPDGYLPRDNGARNYGFDVLAEKFSLLLIKILKHNKSNIRLIRFRIGSFFFKIIPIPNFFLVYNGKNPFLNILIWGTRRAYRVLFERGYLKNKLSVYLPKIRQNKST